MTRMFLLLVHVCHTHAFCGQSPYMGAAHLGSGHGGGSSSKSGENSGRWHVRGRQEDATHREEGGGVLCKEWAAQMSCGAKGGHGGNRRFLKPSWRRGMGVGVRFAGGTMRMEKGEGILRHRTWEKGGGSPMAQMNSK
jgi:hypothetical protein